jgi:hypothetical protein
MIQGEQKVHYYALRDEKASLGESSMDMEDISMKQIQDDIEILKDTIENHDKNKPSRNLSIDILSKQSAELDLWKSKQT